MPLILGMVVALLLLGAGITAATSAFLARNNLRHICDGASAAAADAAQAARLLYPDADRSAVAIGAVGDYLAGRGAAAIAVVSVTGETIELACAQTADVTFGALFGVGTVELAVTSRGAAVL